MKVIFIIFALLISCTTLAATKTATITCYAASDDKDKDGYARAGAVSKDFQVPESTRYSCPTGYVPDDDDCDDTRSSVHPYRIEIPFNSRDDNCNGEIDENEFVVFHGGFDNSDYSYKMRVKLNNEDVLNYYQAGTPIYAKVTYRKITEDSSKDQESDYQRVFFIDYPHSKIGDYKGTNITLSGLDKTTVYRSRVKFYYKSGDTYVPIGIYGPNVYYTTTTDTSEDKDRSQARTGILLQAFMELFYQQIGIVGKLGTEFVNGTRYGADANEKWCTEFYSFVSQWQLKNIYPISNTSDMQTYFGKNFSLVNKLSDLDGALRADWLTLDFDDNGTKDHTAMFLGKYFDGRIVTIEGNTGNRVAIRHRDVSDIYGYGHIASDMVK
jgi:hypothetical protein